MTRTAVQKTDAVDATVLRAGSRIRHRALALIEGAMEATRTSNSHLAALLGVGRSAVGQTLKGNGNLTLQTLAEYLGVMGFEVELVPVRKGEISLSMRERRAPRVASITLRDADWTGKQGVHTIPERRGSSARTARSLGHATPVVGWAPQQSLNKSVTSLKVEASR